MMSVILLLFGSNVWRVHGAARTSPYNVQPFSANPSMYLEDSFFGEGMEYDKKENRVLLGSLSRSSTKNYIYSYPYYNGDDPRRFTANDAEIAWDGKVPLGTTLPPNLAGLQIDPSNEDIVWAAVAQFPPSNTSDCGIVKIDFRKNQFLNYYSFRPLVDNHVITLNGQARCLTNDIIVSEGGEIVYVTDFYGYRVFGLDTSNGNTTIIADDVSSLCDDSVTSCPADASNMYPLNGPNGIEIAFVPDNLNQFLVIGVASSKLAIFPISSSKSFPSYGQVSNAYIQPAGALQGIDGIIFDKEKNFLYIAGRGTEGSVMVASRIDSSIQNWLVHTAYSASCVNDGE